MIKAKHVIAPSGVVRFHRPISALIDMLNLYFDKLRGHQKFRPGPLTLRFGSVTDFLERTTELRGLGGN